MPPEDDRERTAKELLDKAAKSGRRSAALAQAQAAVRHAASPYGRPGTPTTVRVQALSPAAQRLLRSRTPLASRVVSTADDELRATYSRSSPSGHTRTPSKASPFPLTPSAARGAPTGRAGAPPSAVSSSSLTDGLL